MEASLSAYFIPEQHGRGWSYSYGKGELGKSVSPWICGFAPAQSQMDLLLNTLHLWKQTKGRHWEAVSQVTGSTMFFQKHGN